MTLIDNHWTRPAKHCPKFEQQFEKKIVLDSKLNYATLEHYTLFYRNALKNLLPEIWESSKLTVIFHINKIRTVLKLMFLYIASFDINTDFGAVFIDHFFLQREELFNLIEKKQN